MAVYAGPDIVEDGLVLCLDAANPRSYPGSGVTWSDLSNNNTGILTNGPSYSTNNFGKLVFDGTNDFIDVSHNNILNPTLNMTLSCWININAFIPFMSILGKGTQTSGSGGFDFRIDSSTELNLVKYFIIDQTVTISTLLTNTWYNISAVQKTTEVEYYINGIKVGTFLNSSAYQTNTESLKICRNRTSIYTPAQISNIFLYNKSLNSSEILQNFNAMRGRFNI